MAQENKITVDKKDIPVTFVVRITRRSNEPNERALLVAKAQDGSGREFVFTYTDFNDYYCDLVVQDL